MATVDEHGAVGRQGPLNCPKPCSMCADGGHHWLPRTESYDHGTDSLECDMWYECKHCDATCCDVEYEQEAAALAAKEKGDDRT